MPELPEVEITARGLSPVFVGTRIEQVVVHNRQLRKPVAVDFAYQLRGQTCQNIGRRAKYLLLSFPNGTVVWHLGMSGSLRFADQKSPRKKHDHIQFMLANGLALNYHDPRRFGFVEFTHSKAQELAYITKLGPEPLTQKFHSDWLYSKAISRKISIKQLIMDAQVVVGVGNIYASEALFAARIHPQTPSNTLTRSQAEDLVGAIRKSLLAAITAGGSTLRDFVNTQAKPGYFQYQWTVYGRDGQPCRRCDENITSAVIGQRSTFWCPACQKNILPD